MSAAAWMWMAWGAMAAGVGAYGWAWRRAGARGRAWLEWGLALAVAGVSAASVATHEPWADELHAWLQAREMTVGELWREMACEGHFLTWHLLLHPFARLGAPVETMGWISWALNAAAVAWFARKAPLGGWAKSAAALSCVFLYLNPAISRCYALVPPILFGLAALWQKRDERPLAFGLLTALLANTHLAMEGTVLALFSAFARQNLFCRKNGKTWRGCGWQWAGLGVMAAGGLLALAQVLPALWESSVRPGRAFTWGYSSRLLLAPCHPGAGWLLAGAGLAALCMVARKRDRCVCWVLAGSLAYLWGFAVFVYPATVVNRAALWVPVALFAAWALAGRGGKGERWIGISVAALGLATMRPEMTWMDWRGEYDPLRGACRWIAERYGKDAEVWINGGDICTEGAAAYLENVVDWRTGRRPELHGYSAKRPHIGPTPFSVRAEGIFQDRPEAESFLVLASMSGWNGLTEQDFAEGGMRAELVRARGVLDPRVAVGEMVLRVERGAAPAGEPVGSGTAAAQGEFWLWRGETRYHAGDRAGAMAAWKRAVQTDGGQWEAMNNLAWVLLEEGRVEEARAWIDKAMEHEAARRNAGARDTEAAVGRVEGR